MLILIHLIRNNCHLFDSTREPISHYNPVFTDKLTRKYLFFLIMIPFEINHTLD